MRGLDYLAQLTLDDAPASTDHRPTIADDATLARARGRLAVLESILERITLTIEEYADEEDWLLRPSNVSTAERELRKAVETMRARIALLETRVSVVLTFDYELGEYRERSTERHPHILREAPWGTSYYERYRCEGRAWCGLRGTFHKLTAGPDIPLCKRCLHLALTEEQRVALTEAWERIRAPVKRGNSWDYDHHQYDRARYTEHYRINGVVY